MALVTTTGSLLRQYNAFTGLSSSERSQSGIARAELVYYNVNDDWDTPGSSNNRLYQSGVIDLPKDFGYVLTDAYVTVKRANDTRLYANATGQFQIRVGGTFGPIITVPLVSSGDRQDNSGATAIGSVVADLYNSIYPSITGDDAEISYYLADKPTMLIYPFGSQAYTTTTNPASQFNFAIGEQTTGGSDYKVTSYVRFLQYDIDQSYNYVLQSPQLTR